MAAISVGSTVVGISLSLVGMSVSRRGSNQN
jgi:hypothetical protein